MGGDAQRVRIPVRVRTGAGRTAVGGRYGAAQLVVAVSARPVDGAANRAVEAAVAAAFGVPRRAVAVVIGPTSRDKVLELAGDPEALRRQFTELLGP